MDRTYPSGVTSWVDVEGGDPETLQAFYAGLFGWTFTQVTPPDLPFGYAVAQLDGDDVAGLGWPGSSGWSTYVAVDDLEATLREVTAAGGRVTSGPEAAGEGGTSAVVADPQGASFRLWQARQRLGAQVTNLPGAWNFSDLHTTDVAAAGEFYGRVFGWELSDLGFATMIRIPGYGDHLASTVDPGIHDRQAAISAPPGFADSIGWLQGVDGDEPAAWRVTFTVADRDESASLVKDLGGRVVRREDTEWTRTAEVLDPGGSRLTLSQFTPPEGGQVS